MRAGPADIVATPSAARLGRSLRTWRALRRVKQSHAAELLGVSQATVSRWERGGHEPSPAEQRALRYLLCARPDSAADRELVRLVMQSGGDMHLVCDLTHRLLAASSSRRACWRRSYAELENTSFWRYASEAIVEAEGRLAELGWYEPAPPEVRVRTGPNASSIVPIRPCVTRWVRIPLSDGSFARLTESCPIEA
ncbi:helix-turn-helix transcriptional regulator [Marinivivus vitaminiproducens]|uniref:helix-turn-helix transcriptional regulator n=1 Tax=Marinivivus vitaminiproducens TaxID=3035935 RepID=UPI0027A6EE21|nr:helix-turn-helix transcriptional regulator [Geminicoccaceae bacterium SCSIO 64248]